MNEKLKIAKDLLKIQAVFLRPDEPFTWASGIKSPIYCDNRLTSPTTRSAWMWKKRPGRHRQEHYPGGRGPNGHQHRWHCPCGHHRPPADNSPWVIPVPPRKTPEEPD